MKYIQLAVDNITDPLRKTACKYAYKQLSALRKQLSANFKKYMYKDSTLISKDTKKDSFIILNVFIYDEIVDKVKRFINTNYPNCEILKKKSINRRCNLIVSVRI